ncbi:MAG: hypothetical protein QM817_02855 [Archangium sp.]
METNGERSFMLQPMRVVALLFLVTSTLAGSALAQTQPPDEFSLPNFDNGQPQPIEPPQPQTQEQQADPSQPPPPPRMNARPPPDPSWTRLGATATLLATGLNGYFFGGDLALMLTVLGTPVSSETVPGEVEGWVLQVGAEGGYGRAGVKQCQGAIFCGNRTSGGFVFKGGWARGLPHVGDSVTRLQTMYFAQAEVLLSYFLIESAPLSPGVKTFELLTRVRIGLHFTGDANRVTNTGVMLMAAAVIEAIPVSKGTQGVSFGLSFGAGF